MLFVLFTLVGLLAAAQPDAPAPAPAPHPQLPERDVVAAMQDYEYRYNLQDVPLHDVAVVIHGHTAYAYAAVGVDGRNDLLQKRGDLWHVLSPGKGEFSPGIFTELGISPRLANLAVKDTCPQPRIANRSMTADQKAIARHTYIGYVPARRVLDLNGRMFSVRSIAYRVCEI